MQAKNMLVLSLTFNSEKWTTKKLLESITKNKQAGKNVIVAVYYHVSKAWNTQKQEGKGCC